MVKASINHMVDLMGQREVLRYHFMLHQFVSNTPTALERLEARKQGGMDAVKKEQGSARAGHSKGCGSWTWGRASWPRSA